jgi:hypothetical protein
MSIAKVCPNITSIQTHVPWRKLLAAKRSELLPLAALPADLAHIEAIEEEIEGRKQLWLGVGGLVAELHTLKHL